MATSPHVQQLIAKARQAHADRLAAAELLRASPVGQQQNLQSQQPTAAQPETNLLTTIATRSAPLESGVALNTEQAMAVEMGLRGTSFALIGAAGTGKTTTTQELIKLVQQASHMLPLSDETKHLSKGAPGLIICGYTNKAVNNIRKKLPTKLQAHCLTIHKLLEYAPEYFSVIDDQGNEKTSMRFAPTRNEVNPLPHISTIIFEESSMIGTDLFGQVLAALPRPYATQFIFLGDIFQLPPVFGPSILGFKMSELPVVELTHVYRQALQSPIISLATAIRTNEFGTWLSSSANETSPVSEQSGQIGLPSAVNSNSNSNSSSAENSNMTQTLVTKLVIDSGEHGKVTIHPWKKRLAAPGALKTITTMITGMISASSYDPEEDQILCPFNKGFGTIELNKGIAEFLTLRRGSITHEVIARFTRSYWSVGDRVLVDRHDAVITDIQPTVGYAGMPPRAASLTLNRSGFDSVLDAGKLVGRTSEEILNELDAIAESDKDDEGKNLASHTITVWIPDLDIERKLCNAGDINAMLLSYALTVHKSQGSEWRRVFILLHSSHATMCSRELMYTAITRAKEELYIVCEGDVGGYKNQLAVAANRAVIPGTTLKEKIDYFAGKASSMTKLS